MERIDNNGLLRSIRYILGVNDKVMSDIFKLGGSSIKEEDVKKILSKEDTPEFEKCSNIDTEMFLNGLITYKRGKKEGGGTEPEDATGRINNNDIFKKLRIAFNLRSEDIMEVFTLAESTITAAEISAIARKEGHRNYKECGNRYIRVLLKGLAPYTRK